MKSLINKPGKFLLSISAFLLLYHVSFAQLSGNYTLNPLAAATNTNYKNWASVTGDLISGSRTDGGTAQGSGVSGAVTFTVYDTVYANQVKFTAISGASASNTITFKSAGGDSSACMLKYASGSTTTTDYVLMLDGADYITFKQIGFERTGTNDYYTVIQLLNTANYNKFIQCLTLTRKSPSNTTTGWVTGNGAHYYLSGAGNYNLISQNRMIYGYNGVFSTTSSSGNTISNNVFDTIGCIGVYMTQQTSLTITENTFNMGDFGSGQGHYVSYSVRLESSPSVTITNNKMYMMASNCQVVRGIVFVNVTGTASLPNQVNNNWILNYGGTASCTGISLYGTAYSDIYYNNFLITNTLSTGAVIHHNASYTNTYVDVVNNNLINKGGGLLYDFPSTNGGLDTVINNNCFVSGSVLGKMNGSSYSTLAAWVSGTGNDANSLNIDPGYVSNYDLHVSNVGINAKAIPYFRVKYDIDGDTRDTSTPDIGADEFYAVANDAGISNLDSPTVFCAGTRTVKVTFQNYGSDTLTSLKIYWEINSTSQTTYSWTGSVSPGNSSSSITLGTYSFAPNTAYDFKIWSDSPNNVSDGNGKNDSLIITIYAGMSGAYSIGDTGALNFQSFNNAISAMSSRGICGALTFNVSDGTYNEQITLAQLPGMGSSNPVIFQSVSGDSTTVVVRLPSSSATGNNNAAIQLAGADYVTFKGITFQRTGTNTISQVLHILNNSNYNTFTNCQMINVVVSTNNTTGVNIWSDQSQDNHNSFLYNYVKFGTYNMLYLGVSTSHESGTVIEGNVFDSAYSNLVQISYNDGAIVKGNTFRNSISHVTGNYDLQLLDCDGSIDVQANYFYNLGSDVAIYQTGCSASAANHGITANNFIAKISLTGILLDAVTYQDVVFNSIHFRGSGSTTAGISTSSATSSNIVLKNNNIVMATGYVFYINSASQISGSDHNNLRANSSQFAYWGSTYNSLASLTAATAKDSHSISVDPQFLSATDLHYKNLALRNAGESVAGVTTDIDGENRNPTNPDIGADEIAPVANDAGISSLTNPNAISCEGTQPVEVILTNYGTNNLTSVSVNWKVNSSGQTPYSWSGNLASFENDTIQLGNYTFTGSTNPVITAWSSAPNGQSDGFTNNDTLSTSIQINSHPTANAGADVDLCIGDSVLIGPTSSSGFSYKWLTLTNNVIGSTSQIYVMPSSNTSYVLEVTDVAAGCSSTDTLDVIIRPLPVSAFTVNNSNQCLNVNNFSFTNTSSGAASYVWNFGDNTTSNLVSPSHSYSANKSYSVFLTSISAYGCIDTSSLQVNVRPKPKSGFTINNPSQCLSTNSFVFANTSTGHTSSFWDFGDNTYSTDSFPPAKTYQYLGTKAIKLLTTSAYGCKDSIIKTVDVRPPPLSSFTVNDSDQCLGGNSFSFTNKSSGAASFLWDFGDASTSANINPLHIYTSAGTFSVKLVSTTTYGCRDSIIKMVYVRLKPNSSFTVNNSYQCLDGNDYMFTNTSIGAFTSYWDFGDGTNSSLLSPTHSYVNAGIYYVKLLSATASGCSDSIIQMITVHPEPDASFLVNNAEQCLNENEFVFSNTSTIPSGTLNYYWDLGDGTINSLVNNTHTYSLVGNYEVWLKAVSLNNCTDSMNQSIQVKANPTVDLGVDDTLYNEEIIILDAGSGFDAYLWSTTETSRQITVDSATYGIGNKTFWVKVTQNACDGFDTIRISILRTISIPEVNGGFDLKLYPNPASNLIHIELSPVDKTLHFTLHDIYGKQLMSFSIRPNNSVFTQQLDISKLAKGIYYLHISNFEYMKLTKFTKY